MKFGAVWNWGVLAASWPPSPRASDDSAANDKAWISFPRIYTADDIASYFGKNHVKVDHWSSDPETSDRFAVVDLPRLEAKLADPERGLYTITLVPTDQDTLDAWARESGVRIIEYDDTSGDTVVQPLDWTPPSRPAVSAVWASTWPLPPSLKDALAAATRSRVAFSARFSSSGPPALP